jgi:hypothetical protein
VPRLSWLCLVARPSPTRWIYRPSQPLRRLWLEKHPRVVSLEFNSNLAWAVFSFASQLEVEWTIKREMQEECNRFLRSHLSKVLHFFALSFKQNTDN